VPSDVSDRSLQFHLGRRFDNHYFSLQHTSYDTAANQFILDPGIRFSYPERDLRRLALFYEGENLADWMPRLSASLYRQTIDRLFVNIVPIPGATSDVFARDAQLTWGLNTQADLALIDGHRTTVGFQYEDDFLDATSTAFMTLPDGTTTPPSVQRDEARIRTTSVFVSHEAPLAPGLTANFGLRGYWVRAALEASTRNPLATNRDRRVIGSAGLVWQPTDAWALRALVSQGYNYPNLKQLFTVARIEGASNIGNPDLRPERSLNLELGARHDDGRTMFDVTLFHMRGRDYILRDPEVDCPPGVRPRCLLWVNISRARSTGLEIHAEHALDGGWTPFVSAAVMRRSFTFPNGFETADTGVPRVAGTIGVRRDLDWGMRPVSLEAFIEGETRARRLTAAGAIDERLDHPGFSRGWATLNLRGTVQLTPRAELQVALGNLTNRRYWPMDQMPGAERNIAVTLRSRF
jgi:hemoglobin/transferrin/lactoferrin receptor protein